MRLFKKLGRSHKTPPPPPEPTGPIRLAPLTHIGGESVMAPASSAPLATLAAPTPTPVLAPQPPAPILVQTSAGPDHRDFDVAKATLPADRTFYSEHFAKAQQEYTRLIERHPEVPTLYAKRCITAYRRGDRTAAQQDEQALALAAPMESDRLAAWTDLYFDRDGGNSSHRLLEKTLDGLLLNGGASNLLAIERLQFLQREYASAAPLPHRAVLRGSIHDVRTVLEFAKPCWPNLPGKLNALLALALGEPAKKAPVVEALLRAGAALADAAALEALGHLAIEAPDADLLVYALDAQLLSPDFVFQAKAAHFNLMQAATGASLAASRKVEALVARGASLVDYPKGSERPSPWRECVRQGPDRMRHFIAQGFPLDGSDVHTGQTPLMDIVTDNRPSCIEPLLRHGPRAAIGWRGGMSAEDLAKSLGRTECLRRITKQADVAPLVQQWEKRYDVNDVDALAEAVNASVPRQGIPLVMAFAESVMGTSPFRKPAEEVYWLRNVFACGDVLALAPGASRAALAQFARTTGPLSDAAGVVKEVCRIVPSEGWQHFFALTPWHLPKQGRFNRIVLRAMLRTFQEWDSRAFALFDVASQLPCTEAEDADKVLRLLSEAREHDRNLTWMAGWLQQQQRLSKGFLSSKWGTNKSDLLFKFETLVSRFVAFGERPDEIPEPEPREYVFQLQREAPHATARTAPAPAATPAPLPEALQAAVDATKNGSLMDREVAAVSVEEIGVLRAALVDDEVDEHFTEPHVTAAVMQVIANVIGPRAMAEVFADPTQPDKRRLLRLFLHCHPDKVAPEHKAAAESLTALLVLVRDLLTHPQAGPCIGMAYAKTDAGIINERLRQTAQRDGGQT